MSEQNKTKTSAPKSEPLEENHIPATAHPASETESAKQMVIGTSVGATDGEHAKATKEQSRQATNPEGSKETNTNVVNPVAPKVEQSGTNEPVSRSVSVPDAAAEPGTWEQRFMNIKGILQEVFNSHHFDNSQVENWKRRAGI